MTQNFATSIKSMRPFPQSPGEEQDGGALNARSGKNAPSLPSPGDRGRESCDDDT